MADDDPLRLLDRAVPDVSTDDGLRRVRRRIRRGKALRGAVALTVVAVAAAALAQTLRSDDVEPVDSGPSPATPAQDPDGDGWTRIADPPLDVSRPLFTSSTWTGSELIVWRASARAEYDSAAAYDPVTNTWRRIELPERITNLAAAWTGDEVVVVGFGGETRAYDPESDEWRMLATAPAPGGNESPTAVWTGTDVVLPFSGLAYSPANDEWRAIDEPVQTLADAVVVDGTVIVIGGTQVPGSRQGNARVSVLEADGSWRDLGEVPIDAQALDATERGDGLVAVNYDMTAARLLSLDGDWEQLPQVPLRVSECYPTVLRAKAIVAVLCSGLAVLDGDDGWVVAPLPPDGGVEAAGDRLFSIGEQSWVFDPARWRARFHGGALRRVPVGTASISVPADATIDSIVQEARNSQLPGETIQLRVTLAGDADCRARVGFFGSIGGRSLEELRSSGDATVTEVRTADDRNPALLVAPDTLDERTHLAWNHNGSDVIDLACPSEEQVRELATWLTVIRDGSIDPLSSPG
jgi:hypothetical protein